MTIRPLIYQLFGPFGLTKRLRSNHRSTIPQIFTIFERHRSKSFLGVFIESTLAINFKESFLTGVLIVHNLTFFAWIIGHALVRILGLFAVKFDFVCRHAPTLILARFEGETRLAKAAIVRVILEGLLARPPQHGPILLTVTFHASFHTLLFVLGRVVPTMVRYLALKVFITHFEVVPIVRTN